ncbi:MAG: patatin-like phospholipase family protein [Chromatiaceae bacterium]|nr:patatin-like phospholipase family protein [Chromatiaceae bacterium]MCP5439257.1 patatin-like phospholipase family protein [Chromatiaceae bacterium]
MLGMLLHTAAATPPGPRVGLVLGGGGARGIAHIGVLRVLEEMRIPIACIAGTSMGSLVGGVYAAGVPLDEITDRLSGIDWDDLFTDDPPRTEKPFRAKSDDFKNLFHLELGQRGTKVLMPPGSTAGYKFEFLLREMVARSGNFARQDFDHLPIPYRAMATDIENGTSKEFRDGDLVKAMRASMSVPGAIAPVEIDGALYVDGGLLQNLPVAAARGACADVVIVVDVGSGLLPRDQLNSALGISLQMINVLMAQNVRESIESLGPDDVLISPELGDFSAANFAESMTLVETGEAAARSKADQLRRFSVSAEDYQAWRASVAARLPTVPPVTSVRVATTSGRVNPQVLEGELARQPGIDLRAHPESDFSLENLNTRLEQVYGRGDFERMDYHVIDRQGTRTVEVQGVEKSWGPNYVKFGLGLASDSDQTRFDASASHRRTWINALGAEWRNDLQIGYRDELTSEFYQPLTLGSGVFVAPRLDLQREPIVYYLSGRRIGDYRVEHARAHLDFGVQNKYGEVRLGAFAGKLNAEEDFGILTFVPDYDLTQVGYNVQVTFDQIDSPSFGRNGVLAQLSSFGTVGDWGSEDEYNKTELLLLGAKSVGNHAVQLAGYVGESLSGDLPNYDPFLLGGFLRGSGYRMDELVGNSVAMARAVYSYKIASLPPPLGRGVYLGGSIEATRASLGINLDSDKKIRPSASIFVGADTFLGPAYLAFGHAFSDDNPNAIYLLLGTP